MKRIERFKDTSWLGREYLGDRVIGVDRGEIGGDKTVYPNKSINPVKTKPPRVLGVVELPSKGLI